MDRMVYVAMTGRQAKPCARRRPTTTTSPMPAPPAFAPTCRRSRASAVDGRRATPRASTPPSRSDRLGRRRRRSSMQTGRDLDVAMQGDGLDRGAGCRRHAKPIRAPATCASMPAGMLQTGAGPSGARRRRADRRAAACIDLLIGGDGTISIVPQGQDAETAGDGRPHQAGESGRRRSSTRGDDGLFRMKDGSDAPRRRQRAARLRRARIQQRQRRRGAWSDDRAGAALRHAGARPCTRRKTTPRPPQLLQAG